MCNIKQVISDKLNSKWRPPPSCIYYFYLFWWNGLFAVSAIYIAAKFYSFTSIGGWVNAVCAKMQDSGRRHIVFYFCSKFGIPAFRTSNVIQMLNFVQLFAIENELGAIDKIKNGGRRNFKFIIFVHFGLFPVEPSTLLQNFIHLRQSAAELLLLVQKFMMTADANFVLLRIFRDTAILKFYKFGLKYLIKPTKSVMFWEIFFTPKYYFSLLSKPRKAHIPYAEIRVLSHKRSWAVFWCDRWEWAGIQKRLEIWGKA